ERTCRSNAVHPVELTLGSVVPGSPMAGIPVSVAPSSSDPGSAATSWPNSIHTAPNRRCLCGERSGSSSVETGSVSSSTRLRYRGSKTCRGTDMPGNSTVFSGKIGSTTAIPSVCSPGGQHGKQHGAARSAHRKVRAPGRKRDGGRRSRDGRARGTGCGLTVAVLTGHVSSHEGLHVEQVPVGAVHHVEEGRHLGDLLDLLLKEPLQELLADVFVLVPGDLGQTLELRGHFTLLLQGQCNQIPRSGEIGHDIAHIGKSEVDVHVQEMTHDHHRVVTFFQGLFVEEPGQLGQVLVVEPGCDRHVLVGGRELVAYLLHEKSVELGKSAVTAHVRNHAFMITHKKGLYEDKKCLLYYLGKPF